MTRLLVSVRDTDEASIALQAGAHLIDVKEPRRGSLGPADVATVRAVCSLVADRVPVSAALGELLQQSETSVRAECVNFAKLGLAACADVANWERIWANVIAEFPATTTPVAVTYADWREAHAPQPSRILSTACQLGCGGMLVDTFHKSRGGLLDHMEQEELADLVDACRSRGLIVVLAGSLTLASIPRVLPLSADYIAVRGAACSAGRQSRLDAGRVRDLLRLLDSDESSYGIGPSIARPAAPDSSRAPKRIA